MTQPTRCDLVVNPTAGRGSAGRALPEVEYALRALLPDTELRIVRAPDPAESEAACRRGVEEADLLLVMGGDGMAHIGINACAQTDVPLGVLPAGTGNDLCRGLGLPLQLSAAVAAVATGQTRTIDLARVQRPDGSTHWVGCVVSTGFDSRVAIRAGRIRLPLGALGYGYAALAELSTFRPLTYRLVIDGEPRDLASMCIFVCNSEFFGGGMRAYPGANPHDGLLDLTVIHPVSRGTLLRLLPELYTGGFVRHPAIERFQAREVTLDGDGLIGTGDGELLGEVPLTVTAAPGALLVRY